MEMRTRGQVALEYLSGFGNFFATEALPGALPEGRNSPQRPPHGLYAEVLSGTAFTAPRAENRSAWLYKLRPSAMHGPYRRVASATALRSGPFDEAETPPNRLRWNPFPIPAAPTDFVDGLLTLAGSGDPASQCGLAVHLYRANRSMSDALLLQRRRRDDVRAAAGLAAPAHRARQARGRARARSRSSRAA